MPEKSLKTSSVTWQSFSIAATTQKVTVTNSGMACEVLLRESSDDPPGEDEKGILLAHSGAMTIDGLSSLKSYKIYAKALDAKGVWLLIWEGLSVTVTS